MNTRNKYESFKGLLSGKQVNTLDRTTLLSCVAEKTKLDLGSVLLKEFIYYTILVIYVNLIPQI
jgi:hypothetical protein